MRPLVQAAVRRPLHLLGAVLLIACGDADGSSPFGPRTEPTFRITRRGFPLVGTVTSWTDARDFYIEAGMRGPCAPYDARGDFERAGGVLVLRVIGRASPPCTAAPGDGALTYEWRVPGAAAAPPRVLLVHTYEDAPWPPDTVLRLAAAVTGQTQAGAPGDHLP